MRISKRDLRVLEGIADFHSVDMLSDETAFLKSLHRRLERASRPCEWGKESGSYFASGKIDPIVTKWIINRHDGGAYDPAPKFCPECGRKVVVK